MAITTKAPIVIVMTLALASFASCSSGEDVYDDTQKDLDANTPHTCEMILNVTKSEFDGSGGSRAVADWTDGDKIYLTFSAGNGVSYGDAIYKDGKWSISYYGSLTQGSTAKCIAVYFDNPESESGSLISLNENTGIYEDTDGSYIFNGKTLSVIANLSPKTGRIRFAGKDDDKIKVYGISHYTNYDFSTGKYTVSSAAVSSKVSSGYTPYIYGEFSDASQPRIILITSTSAFTRLPSTEIFRTGESGYMDIPSESSYMGWLNAAKFKVKDVEFTMIPVVRNEGNFLMAETEVTEALYNAVTGGSATNSQRPAVNFSYNDFVTRLSTQTGILFDIPLFSEWQFAAKGGDKSHGYTYSGGNFINDVAWYKGNSEGNLHEVKQLQPNELGFYDMSGNAAEAVYYSSYSTYIYYVGGYYSSSEAECTITNNMNSSGSYSNSGIRPIIRLTKD